MDERLPVVAGRRMLMSHAHFERSCILALRDEQEKVAPDNNLINLLCEAVRLSREACDEVRIIQCQEDTNGEWVPNPSKPKTP